MTKIQTYINNASLKFNWVKMYDYESGGDLGQFNCFYKATQFIEENNYSVVNVTDRLKQGGQLWGLRKKKT